MEYIAVLAVLIALIMAYPRLNQGVTKTCYKTILKVNIDSLEKDEFGPNKRISMQKNIFLCAPLMPGMYVEELGLNRPLKAVETIVTEDLIAVYLESIMVPFSEVENEAIGLGQFEWKKTS